MGFISEGARPEGTEGQSFRPCKVTILLRRDDLDDDDRATLAGWLNGSLNPAKVYEKLAFVGVFVAETTIRNHLKGRCCHGTGKVR